MPRDSPNGHDHGHKRHQRNIERFSGTSSGGSTISGVLAENPNAPPATFCHGGKCKQHHPQWGGPARGVGAISEAHLVQRGRSHSGEETRQAGRNISRSGNINKWTTYIRVHCNNYAL